MSSMTHSRRMASARTALVIGAVVGALIALAVPGRADAAPRNTAPPKTAAEPQNIVVFGDSFASNPPFFTNVGPGCHRDPSSWPNQLDRMTPKKLSDFSCANSSLEGGYNVYDQAKLARPMITPGTNAVLVQLGFNDYGHGLDFLVRCNVSGCPGGAEQFPALNATRYANRLRPLVTYVRYYAPKARIAIVGYPELYGDDQRDICTKVPGGAPVTRPGTSADPAFMRKLERVQADAARMLGVTFISLRKATRGHGMCAPDAWTEGYFYPFNGTETRLQAHPTRVGDRVAARTVRDALRL